MTKVECKYCGCHNDVEKERCIGCGSSVPGNEGIVDTFRISGFKYQEAYSGASCMTYLPSSSHFIEYGEPSRPIREGLAKGDIFMGDNGAVGICIDEKSQTIRYLSATMVTS